MGAIFGVEVLGLTGLVALGLTGLVATFAVLVFALTELSLIGAILIGAILTGANLGVVTLPTSDILDTGARLDERALSSLREVGVIILPVGVLMVKGVTFDSWID